MRAVAVSLLVALAAAAGNATRLQSECPTRCTCYDYVQQKELICMRAQGLELIVNIQPGRFYSVECDPHDEHALDVDELALLRSALGDAAYNGSTLRFCTLPSRPLGELFAAIHPAAPTALEVLTLDKPRGSNPQPFGLLALRQLSVLRATEPVLLRDLLTTPKLDHLVVREPRVPLRLEKETLQLAAGGRNVTLRTLELSLAGLEWLPPRVFSHVSELRRLFLWGNKLQTLSLDALADLVHLQELDLSQNQLTTLPPALCSVMPTLRRLNLLGNPLAVVPEGVFAQCTALQEAHVQRGALLEVPAGLLAGSVALQELSLAAQQLESLPVGLLRDQRDLRHLDLSDNRIKRLLADTFASLSRLTFLTLDGNDLEEFDSHVFAGLNALQELSANRNKLKRFSRNAFFGVGAGSLQHLRLAHNQLTLQEDALDAQSPLSALTALRYLDLADNRLSIFYDDWRFVLLQLTIINLTQNHYQELNYMDLTFLAENIVVDLRHNNISVIDFNEAEAYERAGGGGARGVRVLLDDNPLYCDCELYASLSYSRINTARPRLEWGTAACAEPEALRGYRIADLSAELLVCELDSCAAVSDNCTCIARPADRTLVVRCAGTAVMPRLDPRMEGSHWHLERSELQLAGNNITSLGRDDPSLFVVSIDLSDNRLVRLDAAAARRLLTPGRKLWLAGNPIACDCDNEQLLLLLHDRSTQVQDYESLRCADGELIRDLALEGLCASPELAIAVTLALLASFVAAIALLYRRYERKIKTWFGPPEDELDSDKYYDAFVSFSHLDEPFVVGELVPALETGPRPLRLCVHLRDWPAGEWIPAQIVRSVEQSRRTIVVLSPNFLESVWGRVEFRAAHAAALREGRARVVVVLYGEELDAHRLDPELRTYLQTNTYIKWGDPYFWHKLKLELPRRRPPRTTVPPPLADLVAARKVGFDDSLELHTSISVPIAPPAPSTVS